MATLVNNADYLDELIKVGADAMTNLYYIEIDGLEDAEKLQFRVRNQDFTPPVFTQKTYSKSYMSVSMDAPAAEYTGNKNFTLTLRLDKDYKVYMKLLELMKAVNNPNLGFATNTVSDNVEKGGFNVNVYALIDSDSVTEKTTYFDKDANKFTLVHSYEQCWISDITTPSFSYANANPMTVQATIEFFKHTDYVKDGMTVGPATGGN